MIVTFGSINVDFIFEMDEAPKPGQTLLAHGFRMEPGGKGANQAVAAARAGAMVAMYGAVGRDALADVATEGLRAFGADVAGISAVDAPTGCASILIDKKGRNQIAVAGGANMLAKADSVPESAVTSDTILVLQMETDPEEVVELLKRAHAVGAYSILNLAPAVRLAPEVLKLCSLLVVNEDEAEAASGWVGCSNDAGALSAALGTAVLTTLGARGAVYVDDHQRLTVEARPIDAVDTTAAGDCFIGVLAASLDAGSTMQAALDRATTAAALCCTRRGSQRSLPSRTEIEQALVEVA